VEPEKFSYIAIDPVIDLARLRKHMNCLRTVWYDVCKSMMS
jgi:hypothetical protein